MCLILLLECVTPSPNANLAQHTYICDRISALGRYINISIDIHVSIYSARLSSWSCWPEFQHASERQPHHHHHAWVCLSRLNEGSRGPHQTTTSCSICLLKLDLTFHFKVVVCFIIFNNHSRYENIDYHLL